MAISTVDQPPTPGRALGLAASATFCFIAAAALAIMVLGKAHRTHAALELSPQMAATAPISAAQPAAPPTRAADIDKPIYAEKALVADPALIEKSPLGPLPRIADDGRRPMTAYAGPAADGKFRIAIVVSGLGIGAKATGAALSSLPAAVTLGFAPYAADVQAWVNRARAAGHEVLLEVPMEPFDFPDSDPGPYTLRAGVDEDSNIQKLNWALSRMTGYAGVTNLLGQRFLADPDALAPVLTSLTRRGLYFYDNGAAPQSLAPNIAGRDGAAFVQGGQTLDSIQTAPDIDKQLSALEEQARAHGTAIGSAFLYPVTVERIALWAKGLSARGFVLVPVSAIVKTQK